MKYIIITLSTILCLSLIGLGYNYYNYNKEYSKTKEITDKIDEANKKIKEIDNYLEENKSTYDDFIKNNETKVKVYEKWLRYQKEVTEAL